MPKAVLTATTGDPVAEAARRRRALTRVASAVEEKMAHRHGAARDNLQVQQATLCDMLDACEAAVAAQPAASAAGALAQALLAADLARRLMERVADDDRAAAGPAFRALGRICYSLAGWLAAEANVDPAELCGDEYAPAADNPFRPDLAGAAA